MEIGAFFLVDAPLGCFLLHHL